MRFGLRTLNLLPFFDAEGGAGGGAPAGGGHSDATPPASSGTPSGQPASSGTPGAPGASGTAQPGSGTPSGGGGQYVYKEDRSNWVPSHVLRERMEKERAQRAQIERELDFHRRQVAALTGVQMPKPPANPEHEQIKQQFFEIFPQFKAVADLDLDKLSKLTQFDFEALQRANQQTSEQIWASHGQRAAQTFEAKVKELYGEIEPKQVQRIINAFVAEASEDADLRRRYEVGDFSVIDEWLGDWSKGLIDPIRKAATQPTPGQLAARRLPRAGGGSAVVGPKPPSLKPSDGDKYHNAAFNAFVNRGR